MLRPSENVGFPLLSTPALLCLQTSANDLSASRFADVVLKPKHAAALHVQASCVSLDHACYNHGPYDRLDTLRRGAHPQNMSQFQSSQLYKTWVA